MIGDIIGSLFHPTEIQAMFKVKFGGYVNKVYEENLIELAKTLKDAEFCYAVLNKVSRSFAMVIQQLPQQLKDAVCIFYLVLRGLDSVEDDMTYDLAPKLQLLRTFHEKLDEPGWNIENVGDSADYRILLAHFEKVIRVYQALEPAYRPAIKDICDRMGNGMADFAEKKVTTLAGYNLYCHYVAGLVGHGLSDLFSASGLEDPNLKNEHKISNSMGLLLQKTNIIRDYLEDLDSGRTWWPDEVWRNYADNLSDFKHNPYGAKSLACLNHMVTDALQHVPDCLEYMSRLKHSQIFRFCAIPQVMAMATLAAVYNNPNVFRKVVKIRKGLTCKMMLESNNMNAVRDCFRSCAADIARRVPPHDPSAVRTLELCEQSKNMCQVEINKSILKFTSAIAWMILLMVSVYLVSSYRSRHFGVVNNNNIVANHSGFNGLHSVDFAAMIAGFFSIGYLFGFFGMQYV